MKIIHLACTAPPEIGGIGSVAARETTLLRARGVDARLIAPESLVETPGGERSFIETVKPSWRFGHAARLPHVRERAASADVIHLHYPFYGTAEPLLWQAESLPPIVITFHMDAAAEDWRALPFWLHRQFIQPTLFDQARTVLVSSLDYARRSSLGTWIEAHPERVNELPFGVHTDFFSPGPSARARFSVPNDAPVILFVGGLDRAHAFKGVEELLRAFRLLDPSAHLLIVGDGGVRPLYEERARQMGLASRVHFLGRVDDGTLRDAYRSADVFVLPSTNGAEAFSLAALEAQACGVPVVASDLPGVRTVVKAGETGLLVPPKDSEALASAIARLLGDAVLRRDLGGCARVHAENFSWEQHVEKLMEVYRRVCASRS